MTTNQTIDGVRKLAEQACGTSPDSAAYRRFIAGMNPTLLLDLTSAAAQPQGEPVAWQVTGSKVWADKVVEVERQADKLIADREDGSRKVALYAEQTAPVAVVLPERRADAATEDQKTWLRGWNSCLDELKRLNPSL